MNVTAPSRHNLKPVASLAEPVCPRVRSFMRPAPSVI